MCGYSAKRATGHKICWYRLLVLSRLQNWKKKKNSVAYWLRSPYFCYNSLAGSRQVISLILSNSFVKCLIKPLAPPTPTLFLAFIFFSFFFICLKFTDILHSRFNCIVTYKCKIHVLWLFSFGDQFLIFYGVALFKKFFWFTYNQTNHSKLVFVFF